MKKVLVAMSGGVDSSVSAFLLKERGYQVVGITICFGLKDISDGKIRCCGPQAIDDARRVCDKLKIAHFVIDLSWVLQEKIINNFVCEYLKGRTPNPCIACNKYIKFGALLEKALASDFDFLATGHYAFISKSGGDYFLKKPKDKLKDQTYFLYSINKESLKFILFPLASFTKTQVREIARKAKLPVAEKPQSQDICFIPEGDYRSIILKRIKEKKPGKIKDLKGNILGEHNGIFSYTIGQRQGLGIGSRGPFYVISIDAKNNEIIVGKAQDLNAKGLIADNLNLFRGDLPKEAFAKIRYAHPEASCRISFYDRKVKVIFRKPQWAITPGQSVVFYNEKGILLGGGTINEVIR
jgi:tRNA-specific 2-thiouridylase